MTSPNPLVGAVIVKNGKVVGKGYHHQAGLPHAEINALRQAGGASKGGTLYVTLEPCDHFGRTPPCTDAIIRSGIRRVVIGMRDPNPINNGRGVRKLRRSGIRLEVGVLEKETQALNRPYIKFITEGMPYVTIKVAESLDGKIATRTGDSKWITSDDARSYVHRLRGIADAVMVGSNTIRRDNPLLTNRIGKKQPVRVVVDSTLKVSPAAKIFSTAHISPVIVATHKAPIAARRVLEKKGVEVLTVGSKDGKTDLREVLKIFAQRGMTQILVEGGGELVASLVQDRLADRFLFFISPKIIGGRAAKTSVEGSGIDRIKDAMIIKNIKIKRFSNDILLEGDAR